MTKEAIAFSFLRTYRICLYSIFLFYIAGTGTRHRNSGFPDHTGNVGTIYIGKEPIFAERSGMLTLHYDQQDRLYKSVLFVFDFEKDIEEYAAWAISTLWYMSPRSDLDDIGNALSLEEDKMIPTDGLWETYDTLDHIEIYQRAERLEQTGEAAIQVTLLDTAIQPNL